MTQDAHELLVALVLGLALSGVAASWWLWTARGG